MLWVIMWYVMWYRSLDPSHGYWLSEPADIKPSKMPTCLLSQNSVCERACVCVHVAQFADAGSIPLVRQGIFLPESTFNADSLYAR